jgi:hypothetical protein
MTKVNISQHSERKHSFIAHAQFNAALMTCKTCNQLAQYATEIVRDTGEMTTEH